MKTHQQTWKTFQAKAEHLTTEQQKQLKGGYRYAPVQNDVPVSNIVWTEIDIRTGLRNSRGNNELNANLTIERP